MANQHQRDFSSGGHRPNTHTKGSFIFEKQKNHNVDLYTMPFFESTLSKNYNPLVEKLKNKYDNIYNPLRATRPVDLSIMIPEPSPNLGGTGYLNQFQTSQYNGTILSPNSVQNIQLRGILKNPMSSRRVSWSDSANTPQNMPSLSIEQQMRNTAPVQMTLPITQVNQFAKKPYSGAETMSSSYKPAVIPSNK